uniref:Uncharacterized protein n=1 Tax=Angiostrongylus cantonensis TaxID=6313 RepID=A0A0K0D9S4_ANGCA
MSSVLRGGMTGRDFMPRTPFGVQVSAQIGRNPFLDAWLANGTSPEPMCHGGNKGRTTFSHLFIACVFLQAYGSLGPLPCFGVRHERPGEVSNQLRAHLG